MVAESIGSVEVYSGLCLRVPVLLSGGCWTVDVESGAV